MTGTWFEHFALPVEGVLVVADLQSAGSMARKQDIGGTTVGVGTVGVRPTGGLLGTMIGSIAWATEARRQAYSLVAFRRRRPSARQRQPAK
ncbi:MAG: hypothetical protein U5Q44_08415 [Dehalococcoidia bacterium]|nr:hypothetical protein [Dehalococcoidia bacterium]